MIDKLNIIYKNIEDITPYENNPRINELAVDKVANSIKEFGFKNPIIIDTDGTIICGHTRRLAAIKLGLDEVPCIIAEDLTEDQVKAYRLADNKVSEFAEWDSDLLAMELGDIDLDMSQFGFESIFEAEDEAEDEEKPQVEFAENLEEDHNYIVLYFDNRVDWLQAETLFDVKPVKELSTRKDGKITKSVERIGIGRVLDGAKALNKILGGGFSEN